MAPAGSAAVPAADDDKDGLSFFTAETRPSTGASVFGRPAEDPLERVFGEEPLVRDEPLGTTDLGDTATVEQVLGDAAGLDQPRDSEAWRRAFILYGPPAQPATDSEHVRESWLSRLRHRSGGAA